MSSALYANLESTTHASKVALVTGGSTGVGLATVAFASRSFAQAKG